MIDSGCKQDLLMHRCLKVGRSNCSIVKDNVLTGAVVLVSLTWNMRACNRYIWDWQRKQCLMERRTQPGAPPTTYGVVWSPFQPDRSGACLPICEQIP